MTTSSLDRDSRRNSSLLSNTRKHKGLSILFQDGISTLVNEQSDAVLSVPLDEQRSDGGSTLRSSDLLIETKGKY